MKLDDLKSQSFWESAAAVIIAGVFIIAGVSALYNSGKSGIVKLARNKINASLQEGIRNRAEKKQEGELAEKKAELLKKPAYLAPFLGDENAEIEIESFFDFTCPYANLFFTNSILKKSRDAIIKSKKAKLVFRNLPVLGGKKSEDLALAAACAGEQGRFWQMAEQIFSHQSDIKRNDMAVFGYANDLNLNMDLFNYCIENKKYSDLILQDQARAEQIGIKSSATFVINGKIVKEGLPDQKEVERWIETN